MTLSWGYYWRNALTLVVEAQFQVQFQATWLRTVLLMLGWAALCVALAKCHRSPWFSSKAGSKAPLGDADPMTCLKKHEVKIKSGARTGSQLWMISLHVLFPSRAGSAGQIWMRRKTISIVSMISHKNENINKFHLTSTTWTAPELHTTWRFKGA